MLGSVAGARCKFISGLPTKGLAAARQLFRCFGLVRLACSAGGLRDSKVRAPDTQSACLLTMTCASSALLNRAYPHDSSGDEAVQVPEPTSPMAGSLALSLPFST